MADTVTLPFTGTGDATAIVATDDAGAGGQVQIVKLAVSANGSATPLTADNTDGLLVNLGANNDVTVAGVATAANQTTGNTSLATLAGAVAGTEVQVDVLTMPTVTVQGDLTALDQLDLTSSDPLAVAIVDGNGDQITSFGGGTQYTEGDIDASITGTAMLWEDGSDTLRAVSAAKPLPVSQTGNITVNAHAVTNAGTFVVQVDGSALTALQLIDDPVAVLGTDTYTEAASKGMVIGAVRRDADTTLVNTTNEIAPLIVDANGHLKVEIFDGGGSHTVDNNGTFVTQIDGAALTALQLIDDPVATLGTTTYTETTTKGMIIGAVRRDADTTLVDTTNEVSPLQVDANGRLKVEIFDGGDSHTVDYATTGSGTATGALRVELPTNGTGVIATVTAVTAITNALPAGTNAIGKLSANSGVDIGDVDVTSIAAGTNRIGDVDIAPRTTGGWSVGNFTSGDTFTALTSTAQVIKGTAGKFGGYYIYNPNASATYVLVYNVAAASVTVGTTTPTLVFCIPASSGANLEILAGIPFGTAMSIAAATTGGGNSAPGSALEAMIWYL
jgi:hypothetical protein